MNKVYICQLQIWHGYDLMSTEILGIFYKKENAVKRVKEKVTAYLKYDELAEIPYKAEEFGSYHIKPGNVKTYWERRYFIVQKRIEDYDEK